MTPALAAAWHWAKGVPQWVWLGLLGAMGIYLIRRDAYHDGKEDGAEEVARTIEELNNDAIERVERVERDTARLGPDELRQRAAASPYNRAAVRKNHAP